MWPFGRIKAELRDQVQRLEARLEASEGANSRLRRALDAKTHECALLRTQMGKYKPVPPILSEEVKKKAREKILASGYTARPQAVRPSTTPVMKSASQEDADRRSRQMQDDNEDRERRARMATVDTIQTQVLPVFTDPTPACPPQSESSSSSHCEPASNSCSGQHSCSSSSSSCSGGSSCGGGGD